MSNENELTPEQKYNKILGDGAERIKQLEYERDHPQSTAPAAKLTPNGVDQTKKGVGDIQGHKDLYNDLIANEKADVIKRTDEIAKGMPKHVQKDMQDNALKIMYPKGKNDFNQVSQRVKEVDNSQERVNGLQAAYAHGRTPNDQGKAPLAPRAEPPPTNKTETTRFTQLINNEKQSSAGKQPEQTKSDKSDSQAKTGSVSSRFTQSFKENKTDITQAKDKTASQDKGSSMSSRFTQSLDQSNDKAASSTPGKSIGSMSGKSRQSLSKD